MRPKTLTSTDRVWLILEVGAFLLALFCLHGMITGRLYFAFSPVWSLLVPWQKPGVPIELLIPGYVALVSGVLAFGRRNLAALFWAECSLIWSAFPIFVSEAAYLPLQWAFCALSVFTHLLPYKYGISTLTRSLVPIPGLLLLAHLPAYMISI